MEGRTHIQRERDAVNWGRWVEEGARRNGVLTVIKREGG